MTAIQPTKAVLNECTIGDPGARFTYSDGNFHVHSLQVFEDHCKPYLTCQLVIETYQNIYEHFLKPAVEVMLDFESPSSPLSGYKTKRYKEQFRIFSYDSRPAPKGQAGGQMIHTLSLIGQEYYNDKHNTVIQNDQGVVGTSVAQRIADKYLKAFGGSTKVMVPSNGPIGQPNHPNQTMNVRPIKAINDILDNCVWSGKFKSCAPVFFRRKQGHVIAPLQYMLENQPIKGHFFHRMGQGASIHATFEEGYNLCIDVRPLSPSGEIMSGIKAGEVGSASQVASSLDLTKGLINKGTIAKAGKSAIAKISTKSPLGSNHILGTIMSSLRDSAISKEGPGGYNNAQAALVTALTLSPKYWVSVPGQSGNQITAGDRILVQMPVPYGDGKFRMITKTLYVARLIQQVNFTDQTTRKQLDMNAKTEMYCVEFNG